MSNDNKLTGGAWAVITPGDGLCVVYEEKHKAEEVARLLPFWKVRRIRWETTDDPKGNEQ